MNKVKQEVHKKDDVIHHTLLKVSEVLAKIGLKAFVIGARSLMIHGIELGRETRDWDLTIDRSFTPELRDILTRELRSRGYKIQWRKWGFLVENDVHIDINYAPLILDEEFIKRSKKLSNNLYLPSLEDIIVLKLMSGERKDLSDLKKTFHQTWHKLDKDYLNRRVKEAGLEKELRRLVKRLGLE